MSEAQFWIRDVIRYHALSEPESIWPDVERTHIFALHGFTITDIGLKPRVSWRYRTHCPKCWEKREEYGFIHSEDMWMHMEKMCPADDGRYTTQR